MLNVIYIRCFIEHLALGPDKCAVSLHYDSENAICHLLSFDIIYKLHNIVNFNFIQASPAWTQGQHAITK